jgi:hypothetical protein
MKKSHHDKPTPPTRRSSKQAWFLAAVVLLGIAVAGALYMMQHTRGAGGTNAATGKQSPLEAIPFNGARAYEYLTQLCALGPRRSGSAAMTAQQKLLVAHFEKLGGKVELQRFRVPDPRDGKLVDMANIIVRWNPEIKDRILLCGHYDTLPFPLRDKDNPKGPFVGANDNGSGVAILMELAHDMPAMKLPCGVDFVLFDGEEYIFTEDDRFFLGSEYFARDYAANPGKCHYRAGVLLDMVGSTDLHIYQERNSVLWKDVRPVVDRLWATAARLGVSDFVAQTKYEVRDDHLPLHDIGGIPACDVIVDFEHDYPYWHTQGDTLDKCSALSLAKVGWVLSEWLKSEAKLPPEKPGR